MVAGINSGQPAGDRAVSLVGSRRFESYLAID